MTSSPSGAGSEPSGAADEDAANLAKLLQLNAAHATQRFTDLAATWGLGGLLHQLEELMSGLGDADRPEVAVQLGVALAAYLNTYGPGGIVGHSDTFRDHP